MSDFVEAYRQRKRQENAFEFADISHYTIEILENFPQVREAYQKRFHEVMVDEYQDTNTFKNGCWNCCLMVTIVLWWEISSSLSIVSVRQTHRFFKKNSNAMRKIHTKASLILLKENFRSSFRSAISNQ